MDEVRNQRLGAFKLLPCSHHHCIYVFKMASIPASVFQLSTENSGICLLNIHAGNSDLKAPQVMMLVHTSVSTHQFPQEPHAGFHVSPAAAVPCSRCSSFNLMFLVVCAGPVTILKEFPSGWFTFLLKYWAPNLIKAAVV